MDTPPPPPTIVLVEDQEDVRCILVRMVQRMTSAAVAGVPSVAEALAVIRRCAVPLIIADYHIGDGTGGELTRLIKILTPETVVAIISADPRIGPAWSDGVAAADYVLHKPFLFSELEAIVRSALAV